MTVPVAVASSTKTPGVYLIVDLLGGAASPGSAPLRALIMAPKVAAGDATNDTEVRTLNGPDDAATFFGGKSLGYLAAKRLFAHYGLASVDGISPAPSAGATAAVDITLTGPSAEAATLRYDAAGRTVDVPWLSGEAVTDHRTRAIAFINALGDDLPVTASAGAPGILALTASGPGPWGNDITCGVTIIEGGAGITASAATANLTGGTTEPAFTTALATVSTTEYRLIVACLSNADAVSTATSSNAERLRDHIQLYDSGLDALLQIGVYGLTGSIANAKTSAIDRNAETMEAVEGLNFQSLPCELAGADAGDQLKWHEIRANYNRIGNKLVGLYGSKDTVADKPSQAELEDMLNNGVTPLSYEKGSGDIQLVRPITTHSLSSSNPDYRCLDLSDVHGLYTVAADLRTALPQEFSNASISPDLPAGADPLPAGVVEIRDVRAWTHARVRIWVAKGVVDGAKLEAAILNGELIVEIDSGDPSQVNIFIPADILAPLAKFSLVVAKAS